MKHLLCALRKWVCLGHKQLHLVFRKVLTHWGFLLPCLFVYFWEHASFIGLLRAPFMNKSYHRELCLEKRHTRRFSAAGLKAYKGDWAEGTVSLEG